jgi:outer membrane protein assembly factor BamD
MRRWLALILLVVLSGCGGGKKVKVADSEIVERDKDLYEAAMKFLDKSRFTAARLDLQTLMQTYTDSEYAPQAKYAYAESFYMEAGHSNLLQAEQEYKNFITFFPTHDLADDAQLKIAMTHIKQLEKPDRDDTQARLAEVELLSMLGNVNYADSPLLDEAKVKLRGVQEILAESILGPAKQYYLRRQFPAVIDRCEEIVKKYPDFTGMDRVLWYIGESKRKMNLLQDSVPYYAQIVRDYPTSDLVKDSKSRLVTLKASVPEPNPLALNRAQQQQAQVHEGKGVLGWMTMGMMGGGKGNGVSTDTKAASVKDKGGALSIETIETGKP